MPTPAPGQLPDPFPVRSFRPKPGSAPLQARIRPPGSKSLTNRAFLLASLAAGETVLRRPLLDADDAQVMRTALGALGVQIDDTDPTRVHVRGVDGRWRPNPGLDEVTLDLRDAGTATRFLAAAAMLSPVPVVIDGSPRMRERPIGELTDALEALGARVEHIAEPGFPPIRVIPPPAGPAPELVLGTTRSSQFISALLLIGPWLDGGLRLRLDGPVTSASYVRMTLDLLDRIEVEHMASADLSVIRVPGSSPRAFDLEIEPDASGATYFWAAGALIPGAAVRVEGIGSASLQGDAGFPDLLARMGAGVVEHPGERLVASPEQSVEVLGADRLRPIMADMSDMPDATMTLAAVAAFADGPSVFRGVRTLRDKETDRIEAMRTELAKIGVIVEADIHQDPDAMTITPPPGGIDTSPDAPRVEFDTYNDHRMAMSLSLIGLRRPNVWIRDPGCVAKTYPGYWDDLAQITG